MENRHRSAVEDAEWVELAQNTHRMMTMVLVAIIAMATVVALPVAGEVVTIAHRYLLPYFVDLRDSVVVDY
jgi:hypothetical protein